MSENTNVTETTATETKAPKAKDFTTYATKAPTSLHSHYAEWMQEKVGMTFTASADDVTKIVQLAVTLYHDYQASDENKARKAAESANKTPKLPSKTKQELAAKDAEIEALRQQLAAATATPANGSPAPSATGEASTQPVGRRTATAKK